MRLARLALVPAIALALAACEDTGKPLAYTTVPVQPFLGTPVLGDPDAPVELTEYASTTCGHCRAFHEDVFPQLKAKYIDTGKVKLAWVVLPTAPEALSRAGAAIARCAGEEKFFDVIGTLFEAQETLFNAASPRQLQQELLAIGAKYDLSPDQVGSCVDDTSIRDVTNQFAGARPASVDGTPSFVIRGAKIEVESFDGLAAALDAEIALAAMPAEPAPPQ